jgi:alpha-1,4-digalacturonate transport system substrate-binding protein
VGGNYLLAFNTSKHLDEATAFVNWMTSPDIQAHYAKIFGLLPANKNAPAVAYDSEDAQAAVKGFQADLDASPRYAATDQAWPQMQSTWDSIKAGVTQAYSGQITTEQAVAGIRAAAEAAVAAGE